MSRYAKRTDDNHRSVVEELRDAMPDATISDASGAGKGCPDLVIGWRGLNFLFELKDPKKPKSGRRLTKAQVGMHSNWQGQIGVGHSAADIAVQIARIALPQR